MAARAATATPPVIAPDADDRVREVARVFVESGKFVPGIAVDEEGRARSWWWPLPAAGDRELIASLCADSSVEMQRDGNFERGADLTQSRRAECAEALDEDRNRDALDRVEVHRAPTADGVVAARASLRSASRESWSSTRAGRAQPRGCSPSRS